MSEIALLRATFSNPEKAERIGQAMVEAGLAACVNISDCLSIYRWEGAMQRDKEAAGLFKTTIVRAPALAARIAELHSYDLAAIEWWPARASDAVAGWVTEATHD
ncbi:MAG: divalent-cation tolerance protein CutA [Sphingomonas sp.]